MRKQRLELWCGARKVPGRLWAEKEDDPQLEKMGVGVERVLNTREGNVCTL